MRSVPPVSLYFLEPVLQAEYQRFMPDFTTKKQKQKMGSVPPVPLCFLEPVLQAEYQRISDFVYIFIEFWELKTKTKKLLHTAVPKFLQEFLPELHSSLDAGKQKKCCAPLCRPPWHGGVFGPQVL